MTWFGWQLAYRLTVHPGPRAMQLPRIPYGCRRPHYDAWIVFIRFLPLHFTTVPDLMFGNITPASEERPDRQNMQHAEYRRDYRRDAVTEVKYRGTVQLRSCKLIAGKRLQRIAMNRMRHNYGWTACACIIQLWQLMFYSCLCRRCLSVFILCLRFWWSRPIRVILLLGAKLVIDYIMDIIKLANILVWAKCVIILIFRRRRRRRRRRIDGAW